MTAVTAGTSLVHDRNEDPGTQHSKAPEPVAPKSWVTAVAGDPHVAGLRADTRASLISLAYALAAAARPDATTSTNWRELAQITGLARATVARHLARLREWELLALVWSTSMSPGHRWSARDHEHVARNQGNQAAVYLLTRPERGLETAD